MATLEVTSGVMSEACLMDGLLHSTDCAIAENAGSTPRNSRKLRPTLSSIIVWKVSNGILECAARKLSIYLFFYRVFPRRPPERRNLNFALMYSWWNNSSAEDNSHLIINSDGCETRNLLRRSDVWIVHLMEDDAVKCTGEHRSGR